MFNNCIYFNLSSLSRKITKVWQEEFGGAGLSPSHGYLLAAIAQPPAATQKDLSELMSLAASTITRFVDVLAQKGLIERTQIGKGGQLELSPLGRQTSARVVRMMETLFNRMQQKLGKERLSSLVSSLQQAHQALEMTPTQGN